LTRCIGYICFCPLSDTGRWQSHSTKAYCCYCSIKDANTIYITWKI